VSRRLSLIHRSGCGARDTDNRNNANPGNHRQYDGPDHRDRCPCTGHKGTVKPANPRTIDSPVIQDTRRFARFRYGADGTDAGISCPSRMRLRGCRTHPVGNVMSTEAASDSSPPPMTKSLSGIIDPAEMQISPIPRKTKPRDTLANSRPAHCYVRTSDCSA